MAKTIIQEKNKMLRTVSYGSCNCFFIRPTICKSSEKSKDFNTSIFRPFRNTSSYSIVGNHSIVSSISLLHLHSSPPTVFFIVVSIIINPIYRSLFLTKLLDMLGVRLVHIISKFFKRVPAVLNSTFPVKMKSWIIRVGASPFNLKPNVIKPSSFLFNFNRKTMSFSSARGVDTFPRTVFSFVKTNRTLSVSTKELCSTFLTIFHNSLEPKKDSRLVSSYPSLVTRLIMI